MTKYEEFKLNLEKLRNSEKKPRLLLHSCCGPCSTHVLNVLEPYFDLTIFYYNPNIYPEEEFFLRLNTQSELLKKLPYKVGLIVEIEDYSVYLKHVNEYKHLGEKSMRCYECYKFRMEKLRDFARENNFDYFTTTLSVSPHKNSAWINEIGESLSSEECIYLYSDFKKENGYLSSTNLAKQYELYRQDYCGCSFSLEETIKRKEEKERKLANTLNKLE